MSRPPYFYLSYAHSGPSSEDAPVTTDHEVYRFYTELSEAVAREASLPLDSKVGFIDQEIELGADSNAAIATALAAAQVFVPLYSPCYFNKSWPVRERHAFRHRLERLGLPGTAHQIPVLWTPFLPWEVNEDIRQASMLGHDIPEYLENGVRALSLLTMFESAYQEIRRRLAEYIVEFARGDLLGISPPPDLSTQPEAAPSDAQIVVAVIAPSEEDLPAGRLSRHYGSASRLWRPYAGQAQPIADYVAATAARLGAVALVGGFAEVSDQFIRRPAILLIDPWIIRTEGGRQALDAVRQAAEQWVAPLLVIDGDEPFRAAESNHLADEVIALMVKSGARKVHKVSRLEEFVNLLPRLITDVLNQFLQHRARPDAAPGKRFSLREQPPTINGKVEP
ncbi:MAG TPA: TIR-like protein FxsC [Candidatus Limnocylindrales bacterium]|nr:TIR-like protein FxsC [Candidatus Limnocylindrales bacterium]